MGSLFRRWCFKRPEPYLWGTTRAYLSAMLISADTVGSGTTLDNGCGVVCIEHIGPPKRPVGKPRHRMFLYIWVVHLWALHEDGEKSHDGEYKACSINNRKPQFSACLSSFNPNNITPYSITTEVTVENLGNVKYPTRLRLY